MNNKEATVKEYLNNYFKVLDINYIYDNLNDLSIDNVFIDGEAFIKRDDNVVVKLVKTDCENPITIEKGPFGNTLYINKNYYIDNIKVLDNLLSFISSNIKKDSLLFGNTCFINEELVNSLCKNDSLSEVSLAPFKGDGYYLKSEDYLKFKNSNIKKVKTLGVNSSLNEVFEPIIDYNYNKILIDNYRYCDLINLKYSLNINSHISDSQIKNLKYVNSNVQIRIDEIMIDKIDLILETLKKYNKHNKIIIEVENKENFNNYVFTHNIKNKNFMIDYNYDQIGFNDYLKLEKILYMAIEPAKDLSPFEKYIYAYNIVKKFKNYKENDSDKDSSRNLYEILTNQYMVCVGFATLFTDLLSKLGISSRKISAFIETSYDNKEKDVEINLENLNFEGHSRVYANIVDEKYSLNGFYVSDPTWDNNLIEDYYNHLIITDNEATQAKRDEHFDLYDGVRLLFNCNSITDFYSKVNLILDKGCYNDLNDVISVLIITYINTLDKKFGEYLYSKYKYLNEYTSKWPTDQTDLMYDLANYIVSKTNNIVSGDTIMSAVKTIYKFVYDYDEETLNEEINKVIIKNMLRQTKAFPVQYKILQDGSKQIMCNMKNKFDINTNSKII